MTVIAVVGAQFGDEGKEKIVQLAASDKGALIAQYAGGVDPGQSLVAEGERLVFHIIPSGHLRRGKSCLLAQGMALDPVTLLEELAALEAHNALNGELWIDQRAMVVLPIHCEIDRLKGEAEGASGAPRVGIGPAYRDQIARLGIRMGELTSPAVLADKIGAAVEATAPILRRLGGEPPEVAPIVDAYAAAGEKLAPRFVDGSRKLFDLWQKGERVVLEGAFGTMVDIRQGYYPFVVSAATTAGGACTGTGLPPRAIHKVIGVAKAYSTRSGAGPFPTELMGELAARLQDAGREISPTSARPRRCGMLDVPALRYAARVNGFEAIAITKLDVLSGFDEIPLCVGYELDGEVRDEPPFAGQSRMQPLMEMLPGWRKSIGDCRAFDELPQNAQRYVKMIEDTAGVRVDYIGVGPDRSQTIVRAEL